MSSLTKNNGVIAIVSGFVLLGYMIIAAVDTSSVRSRENMEAIFLIFKYFSDLMGGLVKYFSFPISIALILFYAFKLSVRNEKNRWGFYLGIGLFVWAVIVTPANNAQALPMEPVSGFMILIYSIISAAISFGFLYFLNNKADSPISGLLIAMMTGSSLICFYFFYRPTSIQPYLLPIAPSVLIGGGLYQVIYKKMEEKNQ